MTTAPLAEILAALDIRGSVANVEAAIMAAYDTGKQDGIALAGSALFDAHDMLTECDVPINVMGAELSLPKRIALLRQNQRDAYEAGIHAEAERMQDAQTVTYPRPNMLTPESQAVADALSGMPRVGGELPEPECGMVATAADGGRFMVTITPTTWRRECVRVDHLVSIEDRRGNVVWLAK